MSSKTVRQQVYRNIYSRAVGAAKKNNQKTIPLHPYKDASTMEYNHPESRKEAKDGHESKGGNAQFNPDSSNTTKIVGAKGAQELCRSAKTLLAGQDSLLALSKRCMVELDSYP